MLTAVISRRRVHDHFILCAFSHFPNFLNENTLIRSWEESSLKTGKLEKQDSLGQSYRLTVSDMRAQAQDM